MRRTAFVLSAALAMGCGSNQSTTTATAQGPVKAKTELPEWVNKGSGAYGGNKKELFAVGSAYGIKNRALLLKAAQNGARSEMQKLFSTYTASLMKQFSESIMAGDPNQASESQMVSEAIKTFSSGTLSGVEVVESFYDPQADVMYALARLDLDGFAGQLQKAEQLSEKVKQAVVRAAEKAHADLEAEEAKHAPEQ